MKVREIEALPEIQEAGRVLAALQARGLGEPAIAAGWLRGFLTDIKPSDIDIAYVGPIHHEQAREYLRAVLKDLNVTSGDWDIKGIWNAGQAHGINHTVENYLCFYVCSIDTVYLASYGKLHDPIGNGFDDALTRTLRLNTYDIDDGRVPTPAEDVYIFMEGCRRIAKFGWSPTYESIERIQRGVKQWELLTIAEQERQITKRILGKYAPHEFEQAKATYDRYGWGFVFDIATKQSQ